MSSKEQLTNGWRAIEAAPMDGSRLLLFCDPYGAGSGHFDQYDGSWCLHFCSFRDVMPTDWQPLPSPPAASRKGDER